MYAFWIFFGAGLLFAVLIVAAFVSDLLRAIRRPTDELRDRIDALEKKIDELNK